MPTIMPYPSSGFEVDDGSAKRNRADIDGVVKEILWKVLDFATLKSNSVSFFNNHRQETTFTKWARATTRVAKVGQGLSKHEKAQKLSLQYWLEAIDPHHRYGRNLRLYYDVWFECESTQPFFHWLDIGDGKEVNLEKCSRTRLQRQCIKYLGLKEREAYEVIIKEGKLVYKENGSLVETVGEVKWIFVLCTSRSLYVGRKKKGCFQHSSFLAGAATTYAGRLIAHGGIIKAIWPYSGHYRPTEENLMEFMSFLEVNNVDVAMIKMYAHNDQGPYQVDEDDKEPIEKTKHVQADKECEFEDLVLCFAKTLYSKWFTATMPMKNGSTLDYPLLLDQQPQAL